MKVLKSDRFKIALVVLTTMILLTACSGGRFDTAKSTNLIIPAVIPVDRQTGLLVAEEVKGGSCPALTELAKDYKLTRDRLRIAKERLE